MYPTEFVKELKFSEKFYPPVHNSSYRDGEFVTLVQMSDNYA